jgi:hypothetical protein
MCVLCEKKQLKKIVDQKEKIYDFPQCSSYVFFFFLLKKYNTSHIILTHLYFYKHTLNDMYLSKEEKNPKHLKLIYLSNYLNNRKLK